MNYSALQAKLTQLETEAAAIRAEGNCLTDAYIDHSKPGGSARGSVAVQYRLRVKGQPAQYLKPEALAEKRAAIARGKQLVKVQKEIAQVTAKLDAIAAKAARLGLVLPVG